MKGRHPCRRPPSTARSGAIGALELRNRFLRKLPRQTYSRLARELESVDVPSGFLVWKPDAPIRSIYFPETAVISIIVVLDGDRPVECGTVGREGFVGVPILLGADSTSTQAICQVEGVAQRLPASTFRDIAEEDAGLRQLGLRYSQALLEQTAQSVACNARHELSERCARWLLMTRDRVDGDDFNLTHEFLAAMLGVRRSTVTVAAGLLQKAGLIDYQRGRIRIRDRARLEAASCECYGIVRRKYEVLLDGDE